MTRGYPKYRPQPLGCVSSKLPAACPSLAGCTVRSHLTLLASGLPRLGDHIATDQELKQTILSLSCLGLVFCRWKAIGTMDVTQFDMMIMGHLRTAILVRKTGQWGHTKMCRVLLGAKRRVASFWGKCQSFWVRGRAKTKFCTCFCWGALRTPSSASSLDGQVGQAPAPT